MTMFDYIIRDGSLIALIAASEEETAGIISIAGTGYTIDRTLLRQLEGLLPPGSGEFDIIKGLGEGRVDYTVDKDDPLFSPDSQKFLLSWIKYDPAEVLSKLNIPVLFIQPKNDLQVSIEEYEALLNAYPSGRGVIIDEMNHIFKRISTDKDNQSSYEDPSYEINDEIVKEIVSFLSES